MLAKTSVIAHVVATKAFAEAQIPILLASVAKLTAIEIAGIAVALALALLLIKGLVSGKDKKQLEAEAAAAAAAMMARVNALDIGQVCACVCVNTRISPRSFSFHAVTFHCSCCSHFLK